MSHGNMGVCNLTVPISPSVIDETPQSVTVNGGSPYDNDSIIAPGITGDQLRSRIADRAIRRSQRNSPLPLGQRTNA